MKVKLENPQLLAKAIDLISELVMEVRLKVNEFGMSIVAMDPANVAMVSFRIPKSAFSEFEVGQETLGISLDNFKKVLRRCGSSSILILEKKENLLEIAIQDKIKRNFTLGLIEIDSEEKNMPNLEFSAKVEISSQDLVDSVEDCAVVADSCGFSIKEGKFVIEAKGLNSARTEFSGDEAKIEAEDCKSRYSIEYLQKFLKGARICDKSLVFFGNDHPLKMSFKAEHVELDFLLAPRVETDD